MILNNMKKVSIGVILALNFSLANAAVLVIKEHDPVDPNTKATFSQIGLSGEKAHKIDGYGKTMPFLIALDIIVPDSWDVSYNEGSENLLVNWDGDVSWPYVLKDLSSKNDISISVNWEEKYVDLFSHDINRGNLEKESEKEKYLTMIEEEQKNIRNEILLKKEKELREKIELEKMIANKRLQDKIDSDKSKDLYISELKDKVLSTLGEDLTVSEKLDLKTAIKDKKVEVVNNEVKIIEEDIVPVIIIKESEEVVSPKLTDMEVESLLKDYKNRNILPIESSFEFFKSGGYKQTFEYETPATYVAKKDHTVEDILNLWAKDIGWNVKYQTRVHYEIEYDIQLEGNFREASLSLLELYINSGRPLDINYYPKQKLVLVKDLNFNIKK